METLDLRPVIKHAQEGILRKLVDLVPGDRRVEADDLVEQFWQASQAMEVVTPSPGIDSRYASCLRAIDAITLFLKDIDRPATWIEIRTEVVKRGFRPQNATRTAGNISKSLTMYIEGRAAEKGVLKQIGDRVGLGEWPDSRFPAPLVGIVQST